MFERLVERVRVRAQRLARARVIELTARMRAELPRGVEAQVSDDGVRLTGVRLRARYILEPALRRLVR